MAKEREQEVTITLFIMGQSELTTSTAPSRVFMQNHVQTCKILFCIILAGLCAHLSFATCNKAQVGMCANASPFSGDFRMSKMFG